MKRYLKLVNFEINRFVKIYLSLLVITLILQFAGVVLESNEYIDSANRTMVQQSWSKAEYITQYGKISFPVLMQGLWFTGSMALCAAALLFYIFLIWYRDWFGKNTFIYRLLMLPTSRLTIYFAKATAIFLMVLGLIAFQLILLPIQNSLFNSIIPADLRAAMNVDEIVRGSIYRSIIVPNSFSEFILIYGAGLMLVFILFTAILFERSFRLKGIILGILYCLATCSLFLSPVLIMEFTHQANIFYPLEFLAMEIGFGLLVAIASIFISGFLLTKKITV
ncbi:hypothetical protein [Mesobacillus foraminis]|uniref:hypothetical protein n=1 Tax=Mesobacillus foraminis TaxID=279826 RepID=UPI000EF52503|nr:hypothetical protein [Mesobacillus foraminis]